MRRRIGEMCLQALARKRCQSVPGVMPGKSMSELAAHGLHWVNRAGCGQDQIGTTSLHKTHMDYRRANAVLTSSPPGARPRRRTLPTLEQHD